MNQIKQGYKQTKVGIIPEDWDVVKLESISDFITKGATPTTYGFNWQENGIPFLRSECVSDNGLNLKSAMYICQDAHNVMKRSAITSGDILMTITGNVGRVILLENFQEGNINQHIARIRIIKEIANRNFIFSFLSQSTYQINYSKITTGQAYPQLSLVQVRDSFVAFPPLKEQEKIAEILTTCDETISKQEELIEVKVKQKKALIQKLLSGEVRFNGFNDNWIEVKITEIAKTSIGLVTTMTENYQEKGIPLIRNSDIKPNYITKEKLIYLDEKFADSNSNKKLSEKDIVTVHTGEVGISAVIDNELNGCLGFATLNTRIISKEILPEFVCWYFNSTKYLNFALSMSTGDGRNNFNLKDFNKTKIYLPSLQEQEKIVKVLSLSDKEIDLLKKELEELKLQRKALMQKLLTGEVRVRV